MVDNPCRTVFEPIGTRHYSTLWFIPTTLWHLENSPVNYDSLPQLLAPDAYQGIGLTFRVVLYTVLSCTEVLRIPAGRCNKGRWLL